MSDKQGRSLARCLKWDSPRQRFNDINILPLSEGYGLAWQFFFAGLGKSHKHRIGSINNPGNLALESKSMSFASQIIHLTDGFDTRAFPERFSNQIYYSSLTRLKSQISYRTVFSIKLTLQGSETYCVNGRRAVLKPGQLLVVNNGSEVEGFGAMTSPFSRGLSFFIEPDLVSEVLTDRKWLDRNEIPEGPHYEPFVEFDERPFTDERLRGFLCHYASRDIIDPCDYAAIGSALLDYRFRFEDSLRRTEKVRRSTQLEIVRRINMAKSFLDDCASIPFNLEDVAGAACMSKFLLIRCFKRVVGTTPQQYHQQKRVEVAKRLLRCGHTVTETSRQLGFPNIYYFSRRFKKEAGQSPGRWKVQGSNR